MTPGSKNTPAPENDTLARHPETKAEWLAYGLLIGALVNATMTKQTLIDTIAMHEEGQAYGPPSDTPGSTAPTRSGASQTPESAPNTLTLPPLTAPDYRPREVHLDVRLTGDQAVAFTALRDALRDQPARLDCDRPVHNNADVARWLFEQIAKAVV